LKLSITISHEPEICVAGCTPRGKHPSLAADHLSPAHAFPLHLPCTRVGNQLQESSATVHRQHADGRRDAPWLSQHALCCSESPDIARMNRSKPRDADSSKLQKFNVLSPSLHALLEVDAVSPTDYRCSRPSARQIRPLRASNSALSRETAPSNAASLRGCHLHPSAAHCASSSSSSPLRNA